MKPSLNFYCENRADIKKFLENYYSKNFNIKNCLHYSKKFENPIDMVEIISCLIDNNDKYNIAIWISLDENVYISVTEQNINSIIKYLYERYPY